MDTNYDKQLESGTKHDRFTGSFSVGGNDSDKYRENYNKIFGKGKRDKIVSEKFRTKKEKVGSNIVIKIR